MLPAGACTERRIKITHACLQPATSKGRVGEGGVAPSARTVLVLYVTGDQVSWSL